MVAYQCKTCKHVLMINFTDDEEEYLEVEYENDEKIMTGLCCPECVGGTVIELREVNVEWERDVDDDG